MDKISIITTHFYDFSWTKLWAAKIQKNTDQNKIKEVLIINQDRSIESRNLLKQIYPKSQILEYPRNEEQFLKRGHDHAAVLNLAVQEATGEYICIFDSDCHPFSPEWVPACEKLLEKYDAIVALDRYRKIEYSTCLSHPCFMVLKKESIKTTLSFDEGFPLKIYDTGRLIGQQLERMGGNVFYAAPYLAFNNNYGEVFLDSIYHHGKGSYAGGDIRLQKQLDFRQSFFTKIVIKKERYTLNKLEHIQYKLAVIKNHGYLRYILEMANDYVKKFLGINNWVKKDKGQRK
ncbi:MAG: glycosyltransferase [Anaerolineaceae bacterium]|jgi:glycosyltransferase involved in cell wall biosynthesis|nr:glycosyltransferase [Anaerolineaceae bacterium]MDD4042916.1 glycosyltransferase [Anaerolineaceae bacterium]MDD4578424.1 glycosyltransferase [Anaerolineaceae bacterium]